jgi:hypothetical protein
MYKSKEDFERAKNFEAYSEKIKKEKGIKKYYSELSKHIDLIEICLIGKGLKLREGNSYNKLDFNMLATFDTKDGYIIDQLNIKQTKNLRDILTEWLKIRGIE